MIQTETQSGNTSDRPVRLAMVGLGPQGHEHLQAAQFSKHATFVAAVDPSPDARQAISSRFPALASSTFDSVEALRDIELDGLVLALPHHAYQQAWTTLLSLRLPILKEKPLARTLEEAMDFLSAAQQAQCPLQTAIQRRHHPSYVFCREEIRRRDERVLEVHAHLHLGFAQIKTQPTTENWRNSRHQSGGGTLLDSGYHMVDLIHAIVGPFEWVASTLQTGGLLTASDAIEDRVHLWGRTSQTWVALDSWLHGNPDAGSRTGFKKSEGLSIQTDKNRWLVNRAGVWLDGEKQPVFETASDWSQAMATQLDEFATRIRTQRWNAPDVWDQLPSMRIIAQAYQQAMHF
jgi:predicted dehydrogenase